jgi:hypothetical protein
MKTGFKICLLYLFALIALFDVKSAKAGEMQQKIVESTNKRPQLDRMIELNGKKFDFTIDGSLEFDADTGILDSKISFVVKSENKIVWSDPLNGKYSVSVSSGKGELKVSNYISTTTKKHSGWTVLTRSFASKVTGSKKGTEFWAIIIIGDNKKMDVFDDYKNYDSKKDYFVIDLEGASALVVKIGYVSLIDTKS